MGKLDVGALLDQARAHLQADRAARALTATLKAWRATRSPRIAALCARLGQLVDTPPLPAGTQKQLQAAWLARAAEQDASSIPRLLEALTSGTGAQAAVRIEALAWADDPRVVTALERFLVQRPYRSSHAVRPERAARARLEALARPELPMSAAALVACGALEAAVATTRSGDELLAAIYAAPDDDSVREVYADWLQERGAPRGELIALQLRNQDEDRQRALLKAHEATWLGPLAGLVIKRVWRRGFLARCKLATNTRTLRMVAELPAWRTVEAIDVAENTFVPKGYFATPPFAELRALGGVSLDHATALLTTSPLPKLERLSFRFSETADLKPLYTEPCRLPALRTLGLEADIQPRSLARLWKCALGRQLHTLELEASLDDLGSWLKSLVATPIVQLVTPGVCATRAPGAKRWRIEGTGKLGPDDVAALQALPRALLVEPLTPRCAV